MSRFNLNRRWTFILALGVGLACCSATIRSAQAGGGSGGIIADPTEPADVPPLAGDPDLPSGPGTKYRRQGKLVRTDTEGSKLVVGDGAAASRGVWVWRLKFMLRGLKYSVRF